MKGRKKILLCVTAALLALGIFAGGKVLRQYREGRQSRQSFRELEGLIKEPETEETRETTETDDKPKQTEENRGSKENNEDTAVSEKYGDLYAKNHDLIGWIRIEGTNIDYPVMQKKDRPEFYLTHGFDEEYSRYGVPYLDEACDIGKSNNLIIYGHRMRNGSMFNNLRFYTNRSFYEEHKIINFDTLSSPGKYEVIAVFPIDTDHDTFKYNVYTQMDEAAFADFMKNVRDRQYYSTGADVQYGDQLLTLSTCEHTYENGRLVVVAKKI